MPDNREWQFNSVIAKEQLLHNSPQQVKLKLSVVEVSNVLSLIY